MRSQTAPERRSAPQGRPPQPPSPADARSRRRRAAAEPGPAPLTPVSVRVHPRAGRLGPIRLQQLVLIEVAAALVAVGWTVGRTMAGAMAVPAALLLVIALVPMRGRSLPEYLGTVLALRARRRAAPGNVPPTGTDPGIAPALEIDPALRTCTHATETDGGGSGQRRARRETGMVGDSTFLSAVLLVQAKDEPLRPLRTARPLPLSVLTSALQVDDITLESVQVVQHTQPAPAPHLPEQALAARAYQQLPEGPSTPSLRLTWVSLRLDPERAAAAVLARGGGETGTRKALQRAADQLAARLAGAGFTATVLDERELISALATSTCVNPLATAGRQGTGGGAGAGNTRRTQEGRRFWRVDDRWHTTYWISRWPQLSRPGGSGGRTTAPDLVNLLTGLPVLASTFSLTASRGTGGAVAVTGHLRLTARSESEVTQVGRLLESRAQSTGTGLVRLDMEQAPGMLATLPLGGTR
ncbi:type VII secretion protein EccE [Peterkaempfera bronchialis]|uniref:type VII secretion protein EccE n=1 Tax=Peterkaempfera bronchialis TaxID=2126346 RepID=UPI003C2D3D45